MVYGGATRAAGVVYERGLEEWFACLYVGKGDVTFVCDFGTLFVQWYIVYRGHESFGGQIYSFHII